MKQAPAWNAIVKEFTADSEVSFGDVVLREDRIIQGPDGGEMKPGRGGWPVRLGIRPRVRSSFRRTEPAVPPAMALSGRAGPTIATACL